MDGEIITDFEKFKQDFDRAFKETKGCVIFESLDTGNKIYWYEGSIIYTYENCFIPFVKENSNVIIRASKDFEE